MNEPEYATDQLVEALEWIATRADRRPDGTYNYDRDALREHARTALRRFREQQASTGAEERLAAVRQYVEGNRDVWSEDPTDRLGMVYADIFQKVLNVIDTGHPMKEKPR
jgi:hypothetical protein